MEIEAPISSDRFTNWYGMDTENDETGKVTLVCLFMNQVNPRCGRNQASSSNGARNRKILQ